MGTPHRGALEWKALADEFERSGLSQKEFCSRREVSYWSFRRWRRALLESASDSQLVEVEPSVPTTSRPGLLRVMAGSVTIEVGTPVDEPNLTAVLRAVERSQC